MAEDLQPFRVDALAMAGLGGPIAPAPPPSEVEGKKDAGYPTIEHICTKKANFESFSAKVDATMQNLQNAGGPEAEAALKAYGHMNELIGEAIKRTIAEIKRLKAQAKK